jgi:signal peptidase II
MIRWLWLSLGVILLDQASKQLIVLLLVESERIAVLPIFDLTLLYNPGAAFSFLSEQGGWQRWFLSAFAMGVVLVLVVWLSRLATQEKWVAIALALIIGGALGNVMDRLLMGHVVDFLYFHYREYYWPAFNIADSAITIGVGVMLFDAFVLSKKRAEI